MQSLLLVQAYKQPSTSRCQVAAQSLHAGQLVLGSVDCCADSKDVNSAALSHCYDLVCYCFKHDGYIQLRHVIMYIPIMDLD